MPAAPSSFLFLDARSSSILRVSRCHMVSCLLPRSFQSGRLPGGGVKALRACSSTWAWAVTWDLVVPLDSLKHQKGVPQPESYTKSSLFMFFDSFLTPLRSEPGKNPESTTSVNHPSPPLPTDRFRRSLAPESPSPESHSPAGLEASNLQRPMPSTHGGRWMFGGGGHPWSGSRRTKESVKIGAPVV